MAAQVDQEAVTDLIKRIQKLRDAAEQAGDITGAGHLTQAIVSLLASTGDTQAAPTEEEVQTLKRQSAVEYNPARRHQRETELSIALARRDRRKLYLKKQYNRK